MYFFPHIPKSGGTTIKELFYDAFCFKDCIKVWDPNFGADIDGSGFASLPLEYFSGKKAIIGHLSFRDMLKNPYMASLHKRGHIKPVTVIRDPIERIISERNYKCAMTNHPYHKSTLSKPPITDIMERKENFQVQFLREVDDEPVRSIVNRMECFAIKGSEEKLRIWLQRETNKEIKIITPKNVTQEKFPNYTPLDKSFLSKEELKILYQKHEEDFRLYRLAK